MQFFDHGEPGAMRGEKAGTSQILLLSSFIIAGASPVIYRLAQLVLPEGHK